MIPRVALVLVVCLAVCPCLARDPQGEPAAPPRVYTNADLARFAGDTDPAPAPLPDTSEGWTFVQEHLAREYARLDAERAFDLAREEAQEPVAEDQMFLGAPYYDGYPYVTGPGDERSCRRDPRIASFASDWPRTLHAGPTPTQVFRARAIQNKGSDAFPR